ncbi:aldehyde dehydrogenase family protein [Burkholderiaceae bacterium FT117]|uniref:aldehyde dehydrogenase family protein n=1 Tax=Zeimonas sediminis TaxID=2944268 RepID=UPI002342CA6D|nr:aldehyde dehydrogenase family protein [Zeimonas sediminis]MCM5569431.1 aldehyde dehydrogenase family protein [Zeimonas sediminis]
MTIEEIAEAPGNPEPSGRVRDLFLRQQSFAPTLRASTARDRIARLEKLGKALRARRADIHRAGVEDSGKPPEEVDLSEIFPVLHEIAQARRHLAKWMRPKRVPPTRAMLGTRAEVRRIPKGVCLIVSPWNYPFNLSFGPLVSAIAAGNTAVLKPSELTPNCSRLIAGIVAETFPPEEVAVVEGGADAARRLLALPFDHVFFTGSTAVGRQVMKAAADHPSPVTLELGGKSPFIVDESADLDRTVRNLVGTKFVNIGQTCVAPDLVYVHERVRDEFLRKLKARIERVYGGDPAAQRASRDYARVVDQRHFERLQGLLDDALARGARIVAGGDLDPQSRFVAPTVLVDLSAGSRILEEEIFGPLLPVIEFSDLDAVIREIGFRPTPLALYVFGEDRERIERVLDGAPSGGACVNSSVIHFAHGNLPFGGLGASGMGNAHGEWGFRTFSHERAVLVDRFGLSHLLFPPYTGKVRALVAATLRFFT